MRHVVRWELGGVGAAVLVAAALLTAGTHFGGEVRRPNSGLTVVVSDASAGIKADCASIDYGDTFFAGAAVQVRDRAGTVLAEAPIRGTPSPSPYGCDWTLRFPHVPSVASYGIELRSDDVPPRVYDYTFSPAELSDLDWRVRIGVIR